MSKTIPGIHHVTAIAGDPQRNVDFYSGILGLRLLKLTVNFDDPGAYHLYYGDELGSPGTILTFFAWPGAQKGRRGAGQLTSTAFSIPERALGYWVDRLKSHCVVMEGPVSRFEEEALTCYDPDGLQLELVAHAGAEPVSPWSGATIPGEHAIRGFHGVTLCVSNLAPTETVLVESLGFQPVAESGERSRYQTGADEPGSVVDVLALPRERRGQVAVGTVHHVAWRTPSDEEELAWREDLTEQGHNVTPVADRNYFHSIYFREPGGVLFEIATDPPGFAIDEPVDELGTHLMLPAWLEPRRAELEQALPPLRLAGARR